jgi:hypothetical protein
MYFLAHNINNLYSELKRRILLANYTQDFFKKYYFVTFKRNNSNGLNNQAPFLLLKNLKKNNGKFKYLLKRIIAETFFLLYAYKTIITIPNYLTQFDLVYKTITEEINVK